MPISKERIQYLLGVWADKKNTGAEENELKEWIQEAEEDSELKEFILGLWQQYRPGEDLNYVDWNSMFDLITQRRQDRKVYPIEKKTKVFSFIKIAAAAAVLLFFVSGYLILVNGSRSDKNNVQQINNSRFKNDIAPAQEQVILTLSDGSTVILDSAVNGSVATQGNVQVIKLNGKLSYNSPVNTLRKVRVDKEVLYNTITTAKGKQYALTLSDGTGVWLNAGSSLRFPASFTGTERNVALTGEGYFEVVPLSPSRKDRDVPKGEHGKVPFIVHIISPLATGDGGMDVQVFGTRFNINAYNDEAVIKTTLLEGSVKIIQKNRLQMLIPGQQAQVSKDGDIRLVKDANLDQAIGWKNGLFDFDNDELPDVMRQFKRWYDIDVAFVGQAPRGHYSGSVRRQVNISEGLKMLETLGGVEFSIDGKKISIKAK